MGILNEYWTHEEFIWLAVFSLQWNMAGVFPMDDVVLDDLSQSNDGISDDDDCIEVGFSYSTTGLRIRIIRSFRGAN